VGVAVMDRVTGEWLQTDGTWGSWQQHGATIGAPGALSTPWTHTFDLGRSGQYGLEVEAFDAAGNASDVVWMPFEVQAPED
jgi:hypothetical protein